MGERFGTFYKPVPVGTVYIPATITDEDIYYLYIGADTHWWLGAHDYRDRGSKNLSAVEIVDRLTNGATIWVYISWDASDADGNRWKSLTWDSFAQALTKYAEIRPELYEDGFGAEHFDAYTAADIWQLAVLGELVFA